ncbi:MAG: hypothetical protein HC906_14725, partial [Bacteroidales bacterium]|nr:hypothetical protein [Bacteroidales bacterium]
MIVTCEKDSVLRIKNGPHSIKANRMFTSSETIKAIRKKVVAGLVGTDYIEIVSGLNPGDSIIISELSTFR